MYLTELNRNALSLFVHEEPYTVLMQFMRFKRGAQRLEPCPFLEGLPGKALWRHQLSSNLLSNDWDCVTEEILVHTHLFHRGSSSQKAPQPGWPPAPPTAPPGSQTNVGIHVHSWWSCCCCWSSVKTKTHEPLQKHEARGFILLWWAQFLRKQTQHIQQTRADRQICKKWLCWASMTHLVVWLLQSQTDIFFILDVMKSCRVHGHHFESPWLQLSQSWFWWSIIIKIKVGAWAELCRLHASAAQLICN